MTVFIEKYLGYTASIIIIIMTLVFKWDLSLMYDYKFLFSNIISIGAISLGFLTTILFQLWSYKSKQIMGYFKNNGYFKILKNYSFTAVISCVLLITLSLLLGIYFDSYLFYKDAIMLTALYNTCIVMVIFCLLRITILFFKIDQLIQIDEKPTIIKKHPKNTFHFDKDN